MRGFFEVLHVAACLGLLILTNEILFIILYVLLIVIGVGTLFGIH